MESKMDANQEHGRQYHARVCLLWTTTTLAFPQGCCPFPFNRLVAVSCLSTSDSTLRDGIAILAAVSFVLIDMKTTGEQRAGKAQAWAAYREAFQNLSRTTRVVQDLIATQNLDRSTVDAAILALEKVHTVYVERRNTLAYLLLPPPTRDLVIVPAPDPDLDKSKVRRVAALLWEVSGRPLGSANVDWHRAEEIIRSVAAA